MESYLTMAEVRNLGERMASVETEVKYLKQTIDDHIKTTKESDDLLTAKHEIMDKKLDSLLTLKSKGAGAFWLASAILGTGIIGFLSHIGDWLRGLAN